MSGIKSGLRPGVSLSRKTRGLSERPNSTGPVGQGEGTYRTRRSPCTLSLIHIFPDVPQTGTIVHVAIDGKYAGYLLISDVVKPHSAQAIKGLKQAGVRKTVMLTGDAEPVAKAVSAEPVSYTHLCAIIISKGDPYAEGMAP